MNGVLVLHGFVTRAGTMALWAETDRSPTGGPRRSRRAAPHPFAVALVPPDAPELPGAAAGTAELLLPSTGSRPTASPELSPARRRDRLRLRPWLVPVATLPPGSDPRTVADLIPGCRPGSSIGYLSEVVAFATDLTARGRVVPALVRAADGSPEARWRPVLASADAARFGELRRMMPPVCRAERVDRERVDRNQVHRERVDRERVHPDRLDGTDADAALRAALDTAVDALVRGRLAPGPATVGTTAPGPATVGTTAPGPATAGTTAPGPTPVGTTVTHRWFAALTGEARFAAAPAPLDELAERLAAWRASAVRHGPVRTCLRLRHLEAPGDFPGADPTDGAGGDGAGGDGAGGDGAGGDGAGGEGVDGDGAGEGRWLLEFLLQSFEDPSVLVPATNVWHDRSTPLSRWLDHPQEQLLADLGRVSRLYPGIGPALRQPQPAELILDVAGAYDFLSHASLLTEAGFGVLLPARWQQPTDLGLTLTVRSREPAAVVLRDNAVGLDEIVDYRWGIALGAERLSESELLDLARVKVPLVRFRGQWVYLDRERLTAGLAFLRRGGSGQMTAGEALRHVRLHADRAAPLPVLEVAGDGWLGGLLDGRPDLHLDRLDAPPKFGTRLRPYQRHGLSWLAFLDRLGLGACLADDMGLGKTVQLLALEALVRADGARPPTLLVCPLSVVGNWQRETARFAPGLTVHTHHGVDRNADRDAGPDRFVGADLVLTTYAVATRDVDILRQVTWDRVVLDEAQQIKNSASAAARAVRQFPARHRVALTGTPVENRLAELWSIMDFLNPGVLGSAHTFRARYSVPIERYRDEPAAGRLRRAVRPFVLRRMKTDPTVITDLPDKLEIKQLCNLTVEQATLYRAVVDEMFVRLADRSGIQRKGLVLAAMSKLKQVCNHPAQLLGDGSAVAGRSGKLDRLEEILDAVLTTGDRALCFTQFVRFGAMLQPYLAARFGVEVAFLHGGTPKGARDAIVERFQSGAGPRVFLLSLKAGGTGLNLTAAQHIVHVDRWWNPAVEAQATDRAFRIGQDRHVRVHKFVCIGTLEEKIDRMIDEKRAMAQLAIGDGESWLTELSTDELRDLFALAPGAVGE